MKFDSIKSRLVLMTLICVLGMGTLVANQHYFTQRLISLNQQRDLLLRMGQDLLQMRRHEKDFLLRFQQSYFQQFNERANALNSRLSSLSVKVAEYKIEGAELSELAASLSEYQALFQRVVSLQTSIGLNTNAGLLGEMKTTENRLLSKSNYTDVELGLLNQLRIDVRDFQLTKDMSSVSSALQLFDQLQQYNRSLFDTNGFDQYKIQLEQLSDAYQSMGLTHNDGLRGQFRRQAHRVESQLRDIDKVLQPVIKAQEEQVQVYSISIAILTSVVLILVLIKSFATFHRAFSNFVMFFYRCKRQYQKIDPRKLGFAEFKSLAELANEMVESRKDIEERLAVVEAELESYAGKNSKSI